MPTRHDTVCLTVSLSVSTGNAGNRAFNRPDTAPPARLHIHTIGTVVERKMHRTRTGPIALRCVTRVGAQIDFFFAVAA